MKTLFNIIFYSIVTTIIYALLMMPIMIYLQNFSIISAPFKLLLNNPFPDVGMVMLHATLIFVCLGSLGIGEVIIKILKLPRKSKKINFQNIKHELEHNALEAWMVGKGFLLFSFIVLAFYTPKFVAYDLNTPTDQLNATQIKIRRDYLADKYEEQTTKEKNLEEIQELLTKLEDKNITVEKREELLKRLATLEIE